MSRLDKALRLWEAASGIDRADTAVTPSAFDATLNDYVREGSAALQVPLEYTEPDPLSAPVQRIRRATAQPKVEAELEARLVTGRVNPVSLEQYRRLAAVLHDVQANSGLKTVMLTSALPNEGRTLTTVNLA